MWSTTSGWRTTLTQRDTPSGSSSRLYSKQTDLQKSSSISLTFLKRIVCIKQEWNKLCLAKRNLKIFKIKKSIASFGDKSLAGIETVKTLSTFKMTSLVSNQQQTSLTEMSTTINSSTRTTVMVKVQTIITHYRLSIDLITRKMKSGSLMLFLTPIQICNDKFNHFKQ